MPASPTSVYDVTRRVVRRMLRLFFREVMVEGLENVPQDRGGLFVATHPNGLVDPALMVAAFPGQVVFGARHGLFDWPLLGRLMRRMGAVPIYRASDVSDLSEAARKTANERSLDGLASELAHGSYSALFPEGLSHDLPSLSRIKTGAARLYYRARFMQPAGSPPPAIIPVGLHYDRKNIFRSRVLVAFHPPEELPEELDVSPGDDAGVLRQAVRGLTNLIEERLQEVAGSTEDWRLHHLMHRAGKVVRAELGWRTGSEHEAPSLSERRLAYSRMWHGYRERAGLDPAALEDFQGRLTRYDQRLRRIGLNDHELTNPPRVVSGWLLALFVVQIVGVYLLFPPILVLGFVINAIPYYLLKIVSRKLSSARKDEATVKLFGGLLLFPLAWALAASAAWFAHQQLRVLFPALPDVAWLAVLTTLLVGVFGGYLMLVYSEMSARTLRAFRVRVLRRRRRSLVEQLIQERSTLCDELLRLGEGLNLPGERLSDGRLVARGGST